MCDFYLPQEGRYTLIFCERSELQLLVTDQRGVCFILWYTSVGRRFEANSVTLTATSADISDMVLGNQIWPFIKLNSLF